MNRTFASIVSALALALTTAHALAATCPGNLGPATTPTADFTVNGDGTVSHTTTGLMWKQCTEGLSGAACATGSATLMNWASALTAAKDSTFAGRSDWRLPSKQELESIVETTCHSPAINDAVFPNTPLNYVWTSTTLEANPAVAWVVVFDYGYSNADVKSYAGLVVRLVRGGQSFDALAAVATPDTVAPETTITSAPLTGTATSASISFSGTDDVGVTGFECSLDGAAFAVCTSPLTLTGLSLGAHTFSVRAVDAAGNKDATPAIANWVVSDGMPPETTITNPPSNSTATTVTIAFTGTDDVAVGGYECSFDGAAFAPCISTVTFLNLSVGSHTFQVRAFDSALNRDPTPTSVTWSVLPLGSQAITFGTSPSLIVGGSGAVTATSGSPNSGNTIVFSSLTPSVCTVSGATVAALATGTCTIAANQAGNANYTAAPQVTQSITVGKTAQTVTLTPPPASATVGTPITLAGTSSAGLPLTFSSLTPAVCTVSGATVTLLAPGICSVAADQAGNATTNPADRVTAQFTVSARAPEAVATPVPTLQAWAIGLLSMLMALWGFGVMRRRI